MFNTTFSPILKFDDTYARTLLVLLFLYFAGKKRLWLMRLIHQSWHLSLLKESDMDDCEAKTLNDCNHARYSP